MMASIPWLDDAFNEARRDFLSSFPAGRHSEFLAFGTIEDVYQEIEDIQSQQEKSKSLIALKRIHPYILGLEDYFGVVDTFVQVKPEILCLIWGPLRLVLQLARSMTKTFQKLVTVLEDIGYMLPQFRAYATSGIFQNNDYVKRMMCLFYRNILDLHLEMLKFFSNKRAHILLEALWPQFRSKLQVIQSNIENNKIVMTSNVTLEHVLQSYEHRRIALQKYEQDKAFQDNLNLKLLSDIMSSPSCALTLQKAIQTASSGTGDTTGKWLFGSTKYEMWLNGGDSKWRCIWIHGIPGAGKTILTANVIKQLEDRGNVVLFAFLSHDHQSFGSTIPVLQSLIYQSTVVDHSLIAQVSEASIGPKSTRDAKFLFNLFCNISQAFDPLFVTIDGLDEIDQLQRQDLVKTMLELVDRCGNVRLLLSSREESDIGRLLQDKSQFAKVDDNNGEEISAYVQGRGKGWLADLRERGADDVACASIMDGLRNVVSRANGNVEPLKSELRVRRPSFDDCLGMFLYAQLVLDLVQIDKQADLDSILRGLADLPEGLDQAYGRILHRLRHNPIAKRILLWVAHAKTSVKQSEVLQAVLIREHMADFATQNKAWVDIRAACGPIVDIREGLVTFVHFTAKEFLIGDFSQNFLGYYQGHTEALTVCLTYLSFKSLDVVFSSEYEEEDEEQVRRRIISGDFVMFPYATEFWFKHIRDLSPLLLGKGEETSSTAKMVEQFYEHRKGSVRVEDQPSFRIFFDDFRCFQDLPDVRKLLAGSSNFFSRLQYGNIQQREERVLEDPTAVSLAMDRFEEALEAMLSNCSSPQHPASCPCKKLHDLYGANVFKCNWYSCAASQTRFSNALSRDSHEQNLHRTIKCTKPDCPFTSLGFRSVQELETHIAKVHDNDIQPVTTATVGMPAEWGQFDTDKITAMLEHAIINSDVPLADTLLGTIIERGADVDFTVLLQLAAWRGSDFMIKSLISKAKEHILNEAKISEVLQHGLYLAILLNNIGSVRSLVSSGADPKGEGGFTHPRVRGRYLTPRNINFSSKTKQKIEPIDTAYETMDPEMVKLFVHDFGLGAPAYGLCAAINSRGRHGWREMSVDQIPQFQRYGLIHQDAFSYGILTSVLFGQPEALEMCLDHGGDPNFAKSFHRCKESPLWKAVEGKSYTKNIDDRVRMIQSLLRAGAAPYPRQQEIKREETRIEELDGLKRVEDYLGMKWKEIVDKVKAGEDLI